MKLQRKLRPAFAAWRYEHNLTLRKTADLLEEQAGFRICSHERVRTLCAPFDDPEFSPPDRELADAIYRLTAGEITSDSFTRPQAQAA